MSDYQIARRWLAKCKKALKLTDWKIDLVVTDDPPHWFQDSECSEGAVWCDIPRKSGKIWVSPKRIRDELKPGADFDTAIGSTVIHEMLHILFDDAGEMRSSENEAFHGTIYTLEALLVGGGIK